MSEAIVRRWAGGAPVATAARAASSGRQEVWFIQADIIGTRAGVDPALSRNCRDLVVVT
jgi:hypothetical protein